MGDWKQLEGKDATYERLTRASMRFEDSSRMCSRVAARLMTDARDTQATAYDLAGYVTSITPER